MKWVYIQVLPSAPHYLIIDLNATQVTKTKQASIACNNSHTPPCRKANYSLPAHSCIYLRLLSTLHSFLEWLNKYRWFDIGRSDLGEKYWCSARCPDERNVCLRRFSVRQAEAANTENFCQLLNGATIFLQGKKERGIWSSDSFVFVITPPCRSSSLLPPFIRVLVWPSLLSSSF